MNDYLSLLQQDEYLNDSSDYDMYGGEVEQKNDLLILDGGFPAIYECVTDVVTTEDDKRVRVYQTKKDLLSVRQILDTRRKTKFLALTREEEPKYNIVRPTMTTGHDDQVDTASSIQYSYMDFNDPNDTIFGARTKRKSSKKTSKRKSSKRKSKKSRKKSKKKSKKKSRKKSRKKSKK